MAVFNMESEVVQLYYTPVLLSVSEMEGIHAAGEQPF